MVENGTVLCLQCSGKFVCRRWWAGGWGVGGGGGGCIAMLLRRVDGECSVASVAKTMS